MAISTPAQVDRVTDGPEEIGPTTVLPAVRENVEFTTEDGKRLVGELATPEGMTPGATLLCLHPLPTHGGFMDSHVFKKASYRLPALVHAAVFRFNTRGTSSPRGTSEGEFEEGLGERYDVEAALRFLQDRGMPNIWLVGWSFGTELALKYGSRTPVLDGVSGAILLSPPLHRADEADLTRWDDCGLPLTVLVPEKDDYLQPAAARQRFSRIPRAKVLGIDGAKHLWVGEKYVRRVHDEIVSTVAGRPMRLKTSWDGPVGTEPRG
ncbi:alpha/beta hydrolase [Kocuria massiliensis]|uniref:alpha/beta hydrolase n=1 Tax=Kocuria massiliensis TaxID=1926282 RepID=UPI0022B955AB|nr:alpha/beta fold hydrolase [Kocuria massiliensis]